MSTAVENLVSLLHAKRCSHGWIAKCPAHDDGQPSLSISEGADGRALLHCHAGCDTSRLLAAMGLTARDLFPTTARLTHGVSAPRQVSVSSATSTSTGPSQFADEFLSIHDCRRAIEMAVTLRNDAKLCERIAKARGWRAETIRDLTVGPHLGWYEGKLAFIYETGVKLRWRQDGERIVRWAFGKPWLWRGSLIGTADKVWLTEGETDAISLIDAGVELQQRTVVVGIPSASTFDGRWANLFEGKEVILVFDADNAGQEATHRVSRLLYPNVASLKQLNWGGLQHAS